MSFRAFASGCLDSLFTADGLIGRMAKQHLQKAALIGLIGAVSMANCLAQTAPTMNPSGGTFITQQQVAITTPDTNVVLRYTVNGTAPTTNSAVVPDNQQVLISQPTTIRAAGFAGTTRGAIITNTFTITGQVATGGFESCVLKTDGSIWSAGNYASTPSQLSGISNVMAIATGDIHTMALKDDGTVWVWGYPTDGEGGDGITNYVFFDNTPREVTELNDVVAIAAGSYHSLALKGDGTVWAWGLNGSGQLGNGGTNNSSIPIQVLGLTNIVAIAGGGYHSLALDASGNVWAFGYNVDGELGLGTNDSPHSTPTQLTNISGISAIAAGAYHSLFLKNDKTVWACGANWFGMLGNNSTVDSWIPVQASGLTGVSDISAGSYFSTALKTNGTAWAWGDNSSRSLGLAATVSGKLIPTAVPTVANGNSISSKDYSSLVVSTNGAVYGWGDNQLGQLGFGTTNASHAPAVTQFISFTLNQAPPVPTGLLVNYNGNNQATLTWSSSGSLIQSFTIQQTTNNGTTWTTIDTVNGSQNSDVINGLSPSASYKFRILANGTYSSSAASSAALSLITLVVTGTNVAPATLTNTATVRTNAGVISRVDFYDGSQLIGSDSNAPWVLVTSNVMAGPHYYTSIAYGTNSTGAAAVGQGSTAVTVNMPYDPMAAYRFVRGNMTNPLLESLVMSIDEVTGVGLAPLGSNSNLFTNGLPWFEQVTSPTLYQLSGVNQFQGIYTNSFQNPMAAFGGAGGGTPLYTGQAYHFAFTSGEQWNGYDYADLQICVYSKNQFSNGAVNVNPIFTTNIALPHQGTSSWNAFASNGYTEAIDLTSKGYPLLTTIQYDSGAQVVDPINNMVSTGLLLTHKSTSSDYYYRISYFGYASFAYSGGLTLTLPFTSSDTNGSVGAFSYGYTLDFTDRPAWVSTSLSMPSFQGKPMPPEYAGKSIDELLNVSAPVTYQFTNNSTNYLALDGSPELRTNPVLDKFVTDMGSNPIALANYVLNNIHLNDAVSYNESGSVSESSINQGGVNRSALAAFLEKEGSPTEQCALLVYLLRKSGYPCAYVFPKHNSLQMLDARMSTILRLQLNGDAPVSGTGPQLLPVNYPWVAAYINNQWVHIFPWIKDTAITEGYDLKDFLPGGYNTGIGWLQHYLYRDTNILSLSTEFDNPGVLYPLFINKYLTNNGLTTNDVGATIVDRQHNYNDWSDFPQPFQLTTNSLSSSNLVSSLSVMTNSQLGFLSTTIFDTMQCQIFSDSNGVTATNPILDTGVLRMSDLHNRRFMLRSVGTNPSSMTLQLSLEPMRQSATNVEAFPTNGTMIGKQLISANLTSADDALRFRTIYNRNIPVGAGFNTTNTNSIFLGIVDTQQIQDDRPMRKGDAAVLCLNYGRVTQDMINVQAQNYWTAQQAVINNTNLALDPDTAIGTPLYLAGMTYYKRISDFQNSLMALYKVSELSFSAHGFSKMSPARNTSGQLTNGLINLIQPNVDMSFLQAGYVGNATINPTNGISPVSVFDDWFTILMGEVSAQEHMIINTFYGVTDSASTVHLLHDAQTQGQSIIALTSSNYASAGSVMYTNNGTNKTLQAWAGPGMWASITNALNASAYSIAYVTPGPIVCASNSYSGVGAFVLQPTSMAALISQNMTNPLNGAWGQNPFRNSGASLDFYAPKTASLNYYGSVAQFSVNLASIVHPISDYGNNRISGMDSVISGLFSGTTTLSADQNILSTAYNAMPSYVTLSAPATIQSIFEHGLISTVSDYFGNSQVGFHYSQGVSDPVNVVRGGFYINDTDLTIPGPMPIQFSRNYDSLNLANNEFGTGWKMGYFAYLAASTNSPLIYAAEMDGSVLGYRLQTNSTNTWVPFPADNPTLCNQKGDSVGSVFNPFNNKIIVTGSGTNAVYTLKGSDGSVRTFQIASYPITGTNSITRQRPYLKSWVDAQGNSLTFSFGSDSTQPDYGYLNRITANNGNFLQLDYDTYGHIISANAADGRRLAYGYDNFGDLISVTRPDASMIGYVYQHQPNTGTNATGYYSQHLITQENKPEGRVLVNTYDASGRVLTQSATVGTGGALAVNATFTYSTTTNSDGTLSGTTQVADAYSHITTYTYLSGQITQITDPLSQSETSIWYQPGDNSTGAYPRSLKQHTDKRGLSTLYLYDGNGNLTNSTTIGNITGTGSSSATNTTTYNGNNLPTRINEANGNYKIISYDTTYSFLPSTVTKYASGGGVMNSTVNSYTSQGGVYGLLQQTVQDGANTSYTYNSSGFPTSETQPTGTGDPTVSYTLTYNLRGQLSKKIDAAGQETDYAYDDLGNSIWEERSDANKNLVSWNYNYYNANGEIEWTQGSHYNPTDYTETIYDGGGRVAQKLVWQSQATSSGVAGGNVATTSYSHDLFGNLTQIIDPRGTTTTMGYDAIGQMTNRTCAGLTESFTYEPGGKVATHTYTYNGITGTNGYTYTSTGEPLTQNNPDGTSQSWQYLIDGRISQETLPNGSSKSYSYNDASHQVTVATPIASEISTYDSRGNLISKTDGEGYTFTTTYDALNRPKYEAGPAGVNNAGQQTITHTYDAAGLSRTDVNALGETTVTSFDAISRPLSVMIYGADGSMDRATSYQYSSDHNAVTVTEGAPSSASAPAGTTTYSDFQGKPLLIVKPDGGKKTFAYDANENLISSIDELNRPTGYTYDAFNHIASQTLPDGAITTFSCDQFGNITSRAMPSGLTWNATYNAASQKQTESLTQGGSTTRSFSYTYNTSGNGAGEINTLTDPRGIVTTYSYNSLGRKIQEAAVDPAGQLGVTRSFTLDKRGLLKQVDQSYQNSSLSPSTSVIRTLDGYGAILTEKTYLNGTLKDNWQQAHNAAGRRFWLNELATSTPYTFDYDASGNIFQIVYGADTNYPGGIFEYIYGTDGRLQERSTSGKFQDVTRDSVGRITSSTHKIYANPIPTLLQESLTWRLDGTLGTNAISRVGNSSETRIYGYDSRAHLTAQSFGSTPNASATYQFDGGSSGGLGLRTGITLGIGLSGTNGASFGTWARLNSMAISGSLTNNAIGTPVGQSYDAAGNVTNRIAGGVTDSLTWDAFGQLVADSRSGGTFSSWSAVYDGLGRRLQTTQGSLVIQSSYDPEHEFLELGIRVKSGSTTNQYWKVYGPDLNGVYGGLNGIGGLDTIYQAASATYIMNDAYGHAELSYTTNNAWNPSLSDGYGALPGNAAPVALNASNNPATVVGWLDHYIDPTGFYYMGARYYAPDSGEFLSPDPKGHEASMDLYSYCNGDPVNNYDPDGRLQTQVNNQDLGILSLSQVASQKDLQITPIIGPSSQEVVQASSSSLTPYANLNLQTPVSNNGNTVTQQASINQTSLRLPDYYALNFNVAIPNPLTATLVGWSGTANIDRYGSWYGSLLGFGVGKSATEFSGSLTANWLNQVSQPTKAQLGSFLTGNGINGTIGVWGGVTESYSPGNGFSTGVGFVTPQVGGSYNYSFKGGVLGFGNQKNNAQ